MAISLKSCQYENRVTEINMCVDVETYLIKHKSMGKLTRI